VLYSLPEIGFSPVNFAALVFFTINCPKSFPLRLFRSLSPHQVRGYRQNLRVGDNGLSASAEVRFLLVSDEDWGSLEVAPFVDFGTVWSERTDALEPNTLVSTGASLRWQWQDSLFVRLDYGIPLVEVENRGDSLQESGLSFSAGASVKF
jgi:hemolysin activation/secretion protein